MVWQVPCTCTKIQNHFKELMSAPGARHTATPSVKYSTPVGNSIKSLKHLSLPHPCKGDQSANSRVMMMRPNAGQQHSAKPCRLTIRHIGVAHHATAAPQPAARSSRRAIFGEVASGGLQCHCQRTGITGYIPPIKGLVKRHLYKFTYSKVHSQVNCIVLGQPRRARNSRPGSRPCSHTPGSSSRRAVQRENH